MRPVNANKGGQGIYPWPLDTTNAAYARHWDFDVETAAQKIVGSSPTILDSLNAWVEIVKLASDQVKKGKKRAQYTKDQKAAVSEFLGKLEYKKAAARLGEQLGLYCSFCEDVFQEAVAVEHNCPKSWYPLFSLAWENFLIACSPCNSRKINNPTRSEVVWIFLNKIAPAEERGYYDAIRANYMWPDSYPDAYKAMPLQLEYIDDTGKWAPIPLERSVRTGQAVTSAVDATRTVIAQIYLDDSNTLSLRHVRVIVNPAGPHADQARRMIGLCKFNDNSEGEVGDNLADRRLFKRTQVWFDAIRMVEKLRGKVQLADFNSEWHDVLRLAQLAGFYSVWVQVFNASGLTDPAGTLAVKRFIDETNKAGYFPNTNAIDLL